MNTTKDLPNTHCRSIAETAMNPIGQTFPVMHIHLGGNSEQGSCCAKRFAEFNGNYCESYSSLEQPVASLSAADEGKAAAGTYHPKTEGYYIRRHLYKPPGLLYCGGCTWTRINRQPIIAITWHFFQQTLLEPLTVSGARASCFGERY